MNTKNLTSVEMIGEEIGLELGTTMVKDYQIANPNDVAFYVIGRQIIDQILAQPGCAGIRFYNAYNEMGEKTLVYVGVNAEGNTILEYTCINNDGILMNQPAIVADRAERGGKGDGTKDGGGFDADNWNWDIA